MSKIEHAPSKEFAEYARQTANQMLDLAEEVKRMGGDLDEYIKLARGILAYGEVVDSISLPPKE